MRDRGEIEQGQIDGDKRRYRAGVDGLRERRDKGERGEMNERQRRDRAGIDRWR